MVDLSKMDKKAVAKLFDFSVLPKNTREEDIRRGCALTRQYGFAAFYSSSAYWTPIIKEELAVTDVEIGTGIAFPFGSAPSTVKAFETEDAVRRGCTAVDMVMNIGALMDKRYDVIRQELKDFKNAAGSAVTKCILEVNFLKDEDIVAACKLIAECGIQFAKTSSGQFEGPSLEQFLLMRDTLAGTGVKLKVAGVKFPRPQNAYVFIMAGADRIGTRAAPEIVDSLDKMREIGVIPKLLVQ
ncbi:deoxyribose-phosphate aldolase [Biomaibacter acetigenes]|uniref:Deoxyribose-phosphate aldolase n=1 Tax=Biomaibacter acetigenes TaxID=2316383 RepID=A0A3G2R8E4_9FIRM|nr:deoxyribose-phosphate aldolase [Biomaibacter acetigenes]AYO31706.1 deoxyribose-phosphate aldolase [Biomaibacter acetigenes]